MDRVTLIRAAIAAKDLQMKYVAEQLDITVQAVRKILSGRRTMDDRLYQKFEKFLNPELSMLASSKQQIEYPEQIDNLKLIVDYQKMIISMDANSILKKHLFEQNQEVKIKKILNKRIHILSKDDEELEMQKFYKKIIEILE